MKFKFHIYKTGNLFFFVSNLTEWHFACRLHYNEIWIKKTGPLSKKEKEALASFKKILLKYHYGKEYLGRPLEGYSDKTAWLKLKMWVTPIEYEEIQKILKLFEPRFEKIWNEEYPKLLKHKKRLEGRELKAKSILKDLNTFFGSKVEVNTINSFLFISAMGGGGGANIGKAKITLDISGRNDLNSIFPLIWHEAIHALYQDKIIVETEKYIEINKIKFNIYKHNTIAIISESIVDSLFPDGLLAHKHFNITPRRFTKKIRETLKKENSFYGLDFFQIYKMRGVAKYYIENKKTLDQAYIAKVHKTYLEYLDFMKK